MTVYEEMVAYRTVKWLLLRRSTYPHTRCRAARNQCLICYEFRLEYPQEQTFRTPYETSARDPKRTLGFRDNGRLIRSLLRAY